MANKKLIVEAHKIERAINIVMLLFGISAVVIFGYGLYDPKFGLEAMIIEMFLIVVLAILAQTAILVRVIERIQ